MVEVDNLLTLSTQAYKTDCYTFFSVVINNLSQTGLTSLQNTFIKFKSVCEMYSL